MRRSATVFVHFILLEDPEISEQPPLKLRRLSRKLHPVQLTRQPELSRRNCQINRGRSRNVVITPQGADDPNRVGIRRGPCNSGTCAGANISLIARRSQRSQQDGANQDRKRGPKPREPELSALSP